MATSGKQLVVVMVGGSLLIGTLAAWWALKTTDEADAAKARAAGEAPGEAAAAGEEGAEAADPARRARAAPTRADRGGERPEADDEEPAAPGAAAADRVVAAPTGSARTGAPSDDGDDEGMAPPPPDDRPPPSGTLSKEAVMAGIRAVTPFVRQCFEDAIQQDPSLAGRVVLSFDIEAEDGEGRIPRGEVKESETLSPFFEACVLREVAKATFEAPEGGNGRVSVTYPFLFDPGGGYGGEAPPDEAPPDEAPADEEAPAHP